MTAPLSAAERSLLPDALRGLALGGILLVNLQNFSGYVPWAQAGPDRAAQVFIDFLFNGKWVSTFAMLFGAGVALSVARTDGATQVRRLLGLLLIGALHGTLIWSGDILANYALVGFLLLPLLFLPTAARLVAGMAAASLTVLMILGAAAGAAGIPADPSGAGVDYLYGSARWDLVQGERVRDFLNGVTGGTVFFGGWLLLLFSIGASVASTGLLRDPARFVWPLRIAALVSGVAGIVLNLAFVRLNASPILRDQDLAILLRLTGGLAFALLYASLAALLVAGGRGALLRPFARVGRLALSNYLLQSVVCTLVFYGYGLGQYGKWGALACLAFGVGLYAAQVVLSDLYLRRFSRGPAEALLRAIAYGRLDRSRAGD